MSLYWNESRYEPQNPENELWKGRNCCDTEYFSDLLGIISERTRNLSPDGSQLNQFKLFCQIYSLIKWRYDPRTCWTILSNCLMNLKNSGDSTGFEPMTSAMPVQWSESPRWVELSHLNFSGSWDNRLKLTSKCEDHIVIWFLLINLRSRQHGENRRNERHTQWVTCVVDYFHRFSLHIKWSTEGCICNGNRTQLSPILSVIILVINGKIGRPWSGSLNC